eukprot:GHVU01219117.1.p2 GENE.GHVU01219117.1~~GHVU01219117.1.p2  ORF type:complete len:247 (+),score=47.18 GHVU01219117.1:27-743(+)
MTVSGIPEVEEANRMLARREKKYAELWIGTSTTNFIIEEATAAAAAVEKRKELMAQKIKEFGVRRAKLQELLQKQKRVSSSRSENRLKVHEAKLAELRTNSTALEEQRDRLRARLHEAAKKMAILRREREKLHHHESKKKEPLKAHATAFLFITRIKLTSHALDGNSVKAGNVAPRLRLYNNTCASLSAAFWNEDGSYGKEMEIDLQGESNATPGWLWEKIEQWWNNRKASESFANPR